MTPYPFPGKALGLFQLEQPEFTGVMLSTVSGGGPNNGITYFTTPVATNGSLVATHPGLDPATGPDSTSSGYKQWKGWYDDQNGTGGGTCGASDIVTLKANVERHEGVTQASNSHYGVANNVFQSTQVQLRFEKLYSQQGNAQLLRVAVSTWVNFNNNEIHSAQQAFDSLDTPTVFAIGCTLDFTPNDP